MATKKKSTPTPPPPPPKNLRMDIVLDPQRQEIIKQLCEKTGQNANTKAVFYAANYFLNRKPQDEQKIRELTQELSVVKNELYSVKQNVNSFLNGFTELQKSVASKTEASTTKNLNTLFAEKGASHSDSNSDDFYCPDCDDTATSEELDGDNCPNCDLPLRTEEGSKFGYPESGDPDYLRRCEKCGSPVYKNLYDNWVCPQCKIPVETYPNPDSDLNLGDFFCNECDSYWEEEDLDPGKKCPDCGKKVTKV